MKITLYKWDNLQAVPSFKYGYSLEFCGNYGFIDCDQGTEYELPEGYEVSETVSGETAVFDEKGNHCDIGHTNGHPVLNSVTRRIVLGK